MQASAQPVHRPRERVGEPHMEEQMDVVDHQTVVEQRERETPSGLLEKAHEELERGRLEEKLAVAVACPHLRPQYTTPLPKCNGQPQPMSVQELTSRQGARPLGRPQQQGRAWLSWLQGGLLSAWHRSRNVTRWPHFSNLSGPS